MQIIRKILVVLAVVLAGCATQHKASVPEPTARSAALTKVPNGKVKDFELEREGGRLIYSYDIEVPGQPGIEEVHVDANTGKVLSREHEGAAKEADEARAEADAGTP